MKKEKNLARATTKMELLQVQMKGIRDMNTTVQWEKKKIFFFFN